MTLRLTAEEYRRLQERRAPAGKKPRQAATFALKPDYARELAEQIRGSGALPLPVLEYAFDKQLDGGGRGWCFDLCWPEKRYAVEVDGAAHRIKARFKGDLAKHQAAERLGYRVLRVSPAQVRDGRALKLVWLVFWP